jgi:hypothetical protein
VRRFYETWFIGRWPQDTVVTPITRTGARPKSSTR